jgi:MerR family copper efflux transcriptional regulator
MSDTLLNIGEAAAASGVSAKMIRHYESIGLIPKAKRTMSGYRNYSANDVHTLRFIRQARNLGFPIAQIENLLGLWQDRRRPSRKVKELALAHVKELEERIRELEDMKRTLETLARHCHGDDRPECPILENLEHMASGTASSHKPRDGARRGKHMALRSVRRQ